MRTDFKKYFQVFFNIYFILFILYFGISLFLPYFVSHYTNWAFVSISLNLTYIVLITGAVLFFLAVLIQILSDFKHYKQIILQWDSILKVNVIVILLWLTNIFWLSYTIYWNIAITGLLSCFSQFYFQLYQVILILFYFFYGLFITTFFVALVTLRIYLIYWYKINDLIYFNPFLNLTLFLNILEPYLFMRYRINILVIFLLKKLIIISFIIANIIKTYRLILFKKETTPPQERKFIIAKILIKWSF
ncbi:hypothetical protein C6B38_06630 [Spiroplasma sp. ChiS]|uniref:hypothetical protein n=1 Tax=Spiroplasma sp. ChiS TaxID=2099885 RepID=UPI000CFA6F08|nr:hypothetical protein [Spiroplasma sp. ChiS]PQP78371.1 hypothetical protein C6B38_06630 [Spiroplasma sp. ChiS]